ncbi:MAG: hypothetical protein M1825_006063 [Sarcosagium campestre]|nr:MAG: hypothetical protein M1825_006063 [Sarcosagium campestre]
MPPHHFSVPLRIAQRRAFQPPSLRHFSRSSSATSSSASSSSTSTSTSTRTSASVSTSASTKPPPPDQPSVNPAEISHFDALASTWWDPHGPSRLLHQMNPLRHTFISSCLSSTNTNIINPSTTTTTKSPPGHLRYLDVGCGGGIFAESAARLPTTGKVTAIDPSAAVLSVARAHARRDPTLQSNRLEYRNVSIENLDPSGGTEQPYDVLTLFEVLEHVDTPSRFLEACLPHVRPGGWIILSTIARTWTSWLTTKLLAEDVLRIVPRGTHDWNKYVDERELRDWFARRHSWGSPRAMGVVYVPGLGWTEVQGAEAVGNYFFGIRRSLDHGRD